MQNFEHCKYTYRHRRAFEYVVEKLFAKDPYVHKQMVQRARAHDIDKLIMYQCTSKAEASKLHKATAPHHMNNDREHSYYDMLEAVMDYECAGYTKPDKPLNAWDTIQYFQQNGANPELCTRLLALCTQYGLQGSYRVAEIDQEGMRQMEQYRDVTEEMIHEDIMSYFRYQLCMDSGAMS
jgi:hypothetical protein